MLVRMRDESGRSVPPGAFLPAVERYNLSVRYDKWVIGAALKWMSASHAVQQPRLALFHQSFARQLVDGPEMAEFIRQSLATSGVDPRHVGFETSESVAIGNLGKANQLDHDAAPHGLLVRPRRFRQRRFVVCLPEGARRRLT